MSRHAESLKRVHTRLRDRQGNPTFSWYGSDLECTAATYSRGTVLQVGGQEVSADLVLFVRKDQFFVMSNQAEGFAASDFNMAGNLPYPVSGKLLTFTGRKFRIELVHDAMPAETDTQLQLVCVSVTK